MGGWFQESYLPEGLSSLRELQQAARLSNPEAAAFLGISKRTLVRWRQFDNAPQWARLLLAMRAGFIPWAGWEGWRIVPEGLLPPAYFDRPLSPGEVLGMFFVRQEVAAHRAREREFWALADQAQTSQVPPKTLKKIGETNA